MITVTIETEGDSRTMRATGHAGYNAGNDVVCASFSTLAYQLANLLAEMGAGEMEDDGATMTIRSAQAGAAALMAWRGFELGAQMLEDAYPENIKILQKQQTSQN